jgi:hypothetical protein
MADTKNEPPPALGRDIIDQDLQKRLVPDLGQDLLGSTGDRLKAFTKTAGKDDHIWEHII